MKISQKMKISLLENFINFVKKINLNLIYYLDIEKTPKILKKKKNFMKKL